MLGDYPETILKIVNFQRNPIFDPAEHLKSQKKKEKKRKNPGLPLYTLAYIKKEKSSTESRVGADVLYYYVHNTRDSKLKQTYWFDNDTIGHYTLVKKET